VFLNVVKGNVGRVIAEEFVSFVESDYRPLLSYDEVFTGNSLAEAVRERVKSETHTRLYLSARNILKNLEAMLSHQNTESIPSSHGGDSNQTMNRLMEFLKLYPVDLMVGIMKDIKNSYPEVYKQAVENEAFIEAYFASYRTIR
jgi:hypothetical protein